MKIRRKKKLKAKRTTLKYQDNINRSCFKVLHIPTDSLYLQLLLMAAIPESVTKRRPAARLPPTVKFTTALGDFSVVE